MLQPLLSEIEACEAKLKSHGSLHKRCLALPSSIVHTRAVVKCARRKNGSSKTYINLPGSDNANYELSFYQFNLLFVKYWLEWSLGYDSNEYVVRGLGDSYTWCTYGKSIDLYGIYGLYSCQTITDYPNMRPLWIHPRCKTTKMLSGKPDRPGYWKVKVISGKLQDYLLTMRRWNCSYALKKDMLYFSNTLAASAGLPPNAQHLNFPKFEMLFSPRCFGGLAVSTDYRVSKGRFWYQKDLVCQIVNHYVVDYDTFRRLDNSFGVVVDALEGNALAVFCHFVAASIGKFELKQFLLEVDSFIRGLTKQSYV